MKSKPLLSIVIPCLNEETTIGKVLDDAIFHGKKYFSNNFEVLVADNGSNDNSLKIVRKFRLVRLIKVPIRGYGAALHWGIISARGQYVIFADADCSYPFSNLKRFQSTLHYKPDLVLGSRLRGKIENKAMPWLNRNFGTPLLTALIRLIYGIPTSDCNSGMRLVNKRFYKSLNMHNSGMEWASELLLKTALKKGIYAEVPILFKKDQRGRAPHLSPWADGWRHLKAIFLLKPQSLLSFFLVFTFLALVFYPTNFAVAFLFLQLNLVLALSLLTLELLKAGIERQPTPVSRALNQFRLVPVTLFMAVVVILLILVLPDEHLGTKLFLGGLICILFMWIFLIETIKTHLINRLPDAHEK